MDIQKEREKLEEFHRLKRLLEMKVRDLEYKLSGEKHNLETVERSINVLQNRVYSILADKILDENREELKEFY